MDRIDFTITAPDPNAGLLRGKFSVSATKQVQFSQGNLQAYFSEAGTSCTWRFATNQYDYVGNNAANTKVGSNGYVSAAGAVDLFGWVGTSSTVLTSSPAKYGISSSTTKTDYGTSTSDALKDDWGNLAITNGGNATNSGWRTLSKTEWNYLFTGRANAEQKYGHGKIGDVNGMIILPDSWTLPAGLSFTPGNSAWTNSYTTDQWTQMANAGAVFLPVAGYRRGSGASDPNVYARYWSSTPFASNAEHAHYVSFSSGALKAEYYWYRSDGRSVRLVKTVFSGGNGTSSSPYEIGSTADWNTLSTNVIGGTNYSGKYFKMTADIGTAGTPVTTMIGKFDNSTWKKFSGVFDGDGHTLTVSYNNSNAETRTAPFPYTSSETVIKNLTVAGTIKNSARTCGLAGEADGALIMNCRVSATVSGGSHTTGFTLSGARIVNCLFDGKINGNGSTAGFVTYPNSGTLTNCLFKPQDGSSITYGTFYTTNETNYTPTLTNCYYTSTANGVAQGINGSGMTASQLVENLGPSNWKVVDGNAVPKLHPGLSGAGTSASPYLISTTTDWNNLVSAVNGGETYSGTYFKMTANVGTVTTWMTGNTTSTIFSGHFDGDGHTLTVNYSTATDNCGPFGRLGGTVENLHVDGTISTSAMYAGGIAARSAGTAAITNCLSSVTINGSFNGNGNHGGLVGSAYQTTSLTITGCAFTGKMITTNNTQY